MCTEPSEIKRNTFNALYKLPYKEQTLSPKFPTVYIIFENELDSDILNCN